MAFVDKMLSSNDDDFYVTRGDIIEFTGLSPCAVSNNLSVCVKSGWLRREENISNKGREVRYYLNNDELFDFVEKYLR